MRGRLKDMNVVTCIYSGSTTLINEEETFLQDFPEILKHLSQNFDKILKKCFLWYYFYSDSCSMSSFHHILCVWSCYMENSTCSIENIYTYSSMNDSVDMVITINHMQKITSSSISISENKSNTKYHYNLW